MGICGDTDTSPRITDAIFAGCIPIIFLRWPSPMPFQRTLNWSSFAIILNTSSLWDGSFEAEIRHLRNNPERIQELRRHVYEVRSYLLADRSCSSPARGMDTFLHELSLLKI